MARPPKNILVVVCGEDGSEERVEYDSAAPEPNEPAGTPGSQQEGAKMAQPGPNRVAKAKGRVDHMMALAGRTFDICGHWNADLERALDQVGEGLDLAQRTLAGLPAGFVPPRKPIERKYQRLASGDLAQLAEKTAKKYMGKLAGQELVIVAIEDGWASCTIGAEPQTYTVQVKHLVPFKPNAAAETSAQT